MAIRGEIISFVLPGVGTYIIPHVIHTGDRAKGLVFFLAASIDGNSQEIYSLGYADGNLNNIGNAGGQGQAFGVCISSRGYTTSYSIVAESTSPFFGGAVSRMRGYVSAVNVGSFQVTIDLNQLPGSTWFAVILTGDSDVSISVGIASTSAADTPTTVHLGYRPVALLTLGVPAVGINGEVAGLFHDNGFAAACETLQVGMSSASGTITNRGGGYVSDSFLERDYILPTHTYGPNGTFAITSWNIDGFTVDRIAGTTNFQTWNVGYMAIGGDGVSANLTRILQPAAPGIQNTVLTADDPVLAFFTSRCKPTSSAVLFDANMTFGACVGAQNACERFSFPDLTPFPYSRDALQMSTKCISMATATGVSASTVNAEASGVLSGNLLSLDWSSADAIARELWALVLANNNTGSFNACGTAPPVVVCVPEGPPMPGTTTNPAAFSSPSVSPGSGVIV